MPFHFRMQKILDYRQQLEEEAKVKLANAQANLLQCRERLKELLAVLEEANAKSAEFMQASERWLHDLYVKGLRADHATLALQERVLAQIAEEARRHLATCAVDRKMLDKLKERQKDQYHRAELKQELNFNDEIATIRHKAPAVQNNS